MSINSSFSEQSTYKEVLKWASSFLEKNAMETKAAEWLIRERLDWTKTDFIKAANEPMPLKRQNQFKQDIKQYSKGVPLQYIVGHEWFYNRKFTVTADTLIPRPETEEWFDRLLRTMSAPSMRVLDIGTGSGVLAITHKLERPQDQVTATDISESALEIAKINAEKLGAKISFRKGDLSQPVESEQFDLILSNPPYIGEHELLMMDKSVFIHEPHEALFAPEDGLALYKRMAKELPDILKNGGEILLEIGYQQGEIVKAIFEDCFPAANIVIWEDFSGHDRVIHIKDE